MASVAHLHPEPAPLLACTVSRDVQDFDLLIEDMEAELGESWGDLSYSKALAYFEQPEAASLEFIALAVDAEDETALGEIAAVVTAAHAKGIKVILVAHQISPAGLHQLLRLGAEDFVPYPLPEGALHEAIERLRRPVAPAGQTPVDQEFPAPAFSARGDRDGVILPVHGLAGGVGASTLAVNLAWELANHSRGKGAAAPRVCLIDLNFQFGSVATYLDLPRREQVFEILSDTASVDSDSFIQSMLTFNEKLSVFTSPADMLPLDFVGPEDISRLLTIARSNFDFVIVDMPTTITLWTETVLNFAHVYFSVITLDMRCAQNALRLVRALKAENLPHEKLRFVLNRAPGFADLSGKSRAKRLAESLSIQIEVMLPDGSKAVTQSNDHGLPLSDTAAKNPLRREIQKLAKQIFDVDSSAEAAAK